MGRKATITKEAILEAAYQILEREGYGAVNIKTVAQEAGCSTQPISWHFGRMPELRKALYAYTAEKMWSGAVERAMTMSSVNAFFETGKNFITIAADHRNVFRFLYVEDPGDMFGNDFSILDSLGDGRITEMIAAEYQKPIELIRPVVSDVVIYTYGVSMFMTWSHAPLQKEEAYRMIYNEGKQKFHIIGIEVE